MRCKLPVRSRTGSSIYTDKILSGYDGCGYVHKGLAKKVTSLLDALKIMCSVNEMPIQEDRIHFKNGTYFIDEDRFIPDKEFCINRLPVAYNPEAPKPDRWLKFLGELLYEEDIPTLQEFMGYTMIPTTRAQKMLIVIGKKDYQPVAGTEGYDWRRTIILRKDGFCEMTDSGDLILCCPLFFCVAGFLKDGFH